MAQELQPMSSVSLAEYMGTNMSVEGVDQKEVNPVGVILYAHGTKMLFIGTREDETRRGSLVCSYQDAPQGFNPNSIIDGQGRLIDLGEFDDLKPFQVQLGKVEISTYRSIRTLPSVTVRIHTNDPVRRTEEKVNIDETELLPIFTGDRGGIAVFSGSSLPEENALLVEKNNGDKKSGILFFMYPNTDLSEPFDSVAGLKSFLGTLNTEFIGIPGYPLQNQTLREFDAAVRDGVLTFGGIETREEIFRTQVIANVRLAARLKNPQYEDFLHTFFPNRDSSTFARAIRKVLVSIFSGNKDYSELASMAINNIILGEEKRRLTEKTPAVRRTEEESNPFMRLSTTKGRDVLQKAGDLDELYDYERDADFFEELLSLIYDAGQNAGCVNDAIVILQEIESTGFPEDEFNFKFNINKKKGSRVVELNDYYSRGQDILNYLMAEAIAKKKQLEAPSIIIPYG